MFACGWVAGSPGGGLTVLEVAATISCRKADRLASALTADAAAAGRGGGGGSTTRGEDRAFAPITCRIGDPTTVFLAGEVGVVETVDWSARSSPALDAGFGLPATACFGLVAVPVDGGSGGVFAARCFARCRASRSPAPTAARALHQKRRKMRKYWHYKRREGGGREECGQCWIWVVWRGDSGTERANI